MEVQKIDMLYLKQSEMQKLFVTKIKTTFPQESPSLRITEWPSEYELERKPIKSLKQLRISGVSWTQKIGAIFSLKFKLSDGNQSPQFGKRKLQESFNFPEQRVAKMKVYKDQDWLRAIEFLDLDGKPLFCINRELLREAEQTG